VCCSVGTYALTVLVSLLILPRSALSGGLYIPSRVDGDTLVVERFAVVLSIPLDTVLERGVILGSVSCIGGYMPPVVVALLGGVLLLPLLLLPLL